MVDCTRLLRALVVSACVRHCMNSSAPTVGDSHPYPCSQSTCHFYHLNLEHPYAKQEVDMVTGPELACITKHCLLSMRAQGSSKAVMPGSILRKHAYRGRPGEVGDIDDLLQEERALLHDRAVVSAQASGDVCARQVR